MRWDFWNNPLVISAFRVKYRRGSPGIVAGVYIIALIALAAWLHRLECEGALPLPWPQFFFACMIAIQTGLSAIIAVMATATSMRNEVANRTLDFQRITALSPQEVLIGKLIGEPALAWLLTLATVPLAAWCMSMGATSALGLVIIYVSIATTTLLFGVVGMVQPFEPTPGKKRAEGGGGSIAFVFIVLSIAFQGRVLANNAWAGAALGLTTPALSIYGLFHVDVWAQKFEFFGRTGPYAFVTPLTQIVLAAFLFRALVRRLVTPQQPLLARGDVYVALLLFDALALALLCDPNRAVFAGVSGVASFALAHLFASLLLTVTATADREQVKNGVWRIAGRPPTIREWWLDGRTLNFLLIGTFVLCGFVAGGGYLSFVAAQGDAPPIEWAAIGQIAAAATAMLLVGGLLLQFFLMIAPSRMAAGFLCLGVAAVVVITPHVAGEYLQSEPLLSLSASAQFAEWIDQGAGRLNAAWLIGPYSAAAATLAYMLFRWRRGTASQVRRTLVDMGVQPA